MRFDPGTAEWSVVREALVEYGFGVLRVWLRNGIARRHAHQYGVLGADAIPTRMDSEDADAIAADVAIESVERFRSTVLAADRWTPDGGASLATFFVRFMLMRLPNATRKWTRASNAIREMATEETPEAADHTPDGESKVVIDDELAEAIVLIGDPGLVDTFRLLADGMTYSEIASMLDRTESQLKSQVMRARARLRSDMEDRRDR